MGYYMIGFEEDTKESLREDIKKLAALKLDITQICVITPLPQTPMWTEIEEKFGIWDHDYHHHDGKHMVWNHPHIKPEEFPEHPGLVLQAGPSLACAPAHLGPGLGQCLPLRRLAGVKEVAAYITRANKFDWKPAFEIAQSECRG